MTGDQLLTDQDRAILEFERHRWKYPGAKETAIFEQFAVTMTRYYQILNGLIEKPAALEHDPMVVRRLARLRSARAAARRSACDPLTRA